jgi:hypothetical protein
MVGCALPGAGTREASALSIAPKVRADDADRTSPGYSVSQAPVAELEAQKRRAEVEQSRVELREANARAREEAMDRPPVAGRKGTTCRRSAEVEGG